MKWKAVNRIEVAYQTALKKLSAAIVKIIRENPEEHVVNEKVKRLQNSKAFKNYCRAIAQNMVTHVSNHNAKTWRQAAAKSGQGKTIYKLLKKYSIDNKAMFDEIIDQNAKIISTMPEEVSKQVVNKISVDALSGMRAETIAKRIKTHTDNHIRASAKLIARTEVSKANEAITRVRCKKLDINWYIWRTSEDARVRSSHEHMEDVLINWNDPPAPEIIIGEVPPKGNPHYHAGNIYNCRCYAEPVVLIEEVDFPHKVCMNNHITKINKKEFLKLL